MTFNQTPSHKSPLVSLVPLALDQADKLAAIIRRDHLDELWYTAIPHPDQVVQEIRRRLALQAEGTMAPWAIYRADGALVGMTTYMNVVAEHRKLEVGSTWMSRDARGTGLNKAAKLLLLTRAFETLGCIAVEFRTHWHNHESRRAIESLGAKQDGVLRNDRIMLNGTLRDTVVYSIIASEWTSVKAALVFAVQSAEGKR